MTKCDVAIIGAGPYGLSAAAHLRSAKGLDVHTFGEPMSFWQQNMPVGMLLRSGWAASHIGAPQGPLTLEEYRAETSHFSTPVPLDRFVDYGLWYQRRAVPDIDRRKISRIELHPNGFKLFVEKGEDVIARRVVVAAGISSFAWRPTIFGGIPKQLASHTAEHRGFQKLANKRVLVIGSGQSALESAALLNEEGAAVQILARTEQIRWLGGLMSRTIHAGLGEKIAKLLYAPTDVGPAGISQIVAKPDLTRRFPRWAQDWLRRRSIRPAGARWLIDRLKEVPMSLGRTAVSATVCGEKVKVKLDDGQERTVDHVLLGTGYRVDVSKYDFLAAPLAESIKRFQGYPHLVDGFETSVRGLHILGAPAVWSFGALMQFVVGTHYASQELLRCVAGKSERNRMLADRPHATGIPERISQESTTHSAA